MIPIACLIRRPSNRWPRPPIEVPDDYLGDLRCANTEKKFEDLRCQSGISSASLLKETAK
jgi:hypothetical protein